MQDLIQELQNPRWLAPSPASLRAAELIKKLTERVETDTKARLDAEQKLTEAYREVEQLRKELADAKETIIKLNADTNCSKSRVSNTESSTNEVSDG